MSRVPILPIPASPLATDMQGQGIPPDTIVVRGYVATVDLMEDINRLLVANGNNAINPPAAVNALMGTNNLPGRIYLSARLDCWIEVDRWEECVARVFEEENTDRLESSTVWLRARTPAGVPIRYRVVTAEILDDNDGFLAGRLVEDYMSRTESGNVVWDEQQFGPTTGKSSTKRCF
jgi:hypothetical protein